MEEPLPRGDRHSIRQERPIVRAESMSLGLKVETNGPGLLQLGPGPMRELIGLSKKGASCCLVPGFVVVVVDHLWQSGGSKFGLIDSSLIICLLLTLFRPLLITSAEPGGTQL